MSVNSKELLAFIVSGAYLPIKKEKEIYLKLFIEYIFYF